jgi:hypothetical protein
MATKTTGAFVASTVQGYTVNTSPASATGGGASDILVSTTINSSINSFENKKIMMGAEVTTEFADIAGVLKLQASHNGTDWADVVTMSSDTTPNVEEVKPFFVDLSNIYSPYFRFIFNDDAKSIGTSGQLNFFYAYK